MRKKRIAQLLLSGVFTLCAAAIVGLLDLAEKVEAEQKAKKEKAASEEAVEGRETRWDRKC